MTEVLSAKGKSWQLTPTTKPLTALVEIAENSSVLAQILLARGIDSPEKARSFLNADYYQPTNAFDLPDIDKAVNRINQALANNEQITIYGDYDVDGITATSLMLNALKKLSAKVTYYIPNRATEGYGLNLKAVSILASKQKTKLLITCDCGVSNFAEINFAKSLGVDTIILDHHTLPELLPPAKAIVHSKLLKEEHPLYHLPGVGVAYKVAEALLNEHNLSAQIEEFLDYVTLGMIADLVPLIRENRYLVQIGLPKLIKSSRPGIQALLSQINQSGDTDIVGFGLAPRINAVGRLADAQIAVELLTTNDHSLAYQLSTQLQNENIKRQQICEQVLSEAEQMINSLGDLSQQKAISIYSEGWHHGVVGIVASRLVEKYNRPVFIAELNPHEGTIKGSARGIASLDLCEILKANSHLLTKWGGHKMAAGFSLPADKGESFNAAIISTCNQLMINKNSAPTLNIEINLEDTNIDLFACAKDLTKLAPFGMENKKPLFYTSKLICEKITPLGRLGKHQRIDLKDQKTNKLFSCVFWNAHETVPKHNQIIDIVYTPEINVFNNKERLQLVLADWRLSALQSTKEYLHSAPQQTISSTNTIKSQANTMAPTIPLVTVADSSAEHIISPPNKQNWVDLRHFENNKKIITTAATTLKENLAIFSEDKNDSIYSSITFDRLSMPKKPHLLINEIPPSATIWQEIIIKSGASKIYILGGIQTSLTDSTTLIKRLMGLIRFVVNKKSGQVEASRLSAALATTDLVSALALLLLRKMGLIDWYSDDGLIYLDLLNDHSQTNIKDLPEYHQLEEVLKEINQFRQWCASAPIRELQKLVLNGADEPTQPHDIATSELDFSITNISTTTPYLANVTSTNNSLA